MNTFGRIFRVTIWGESHSKAIGVVIDGVEAGLTLSEESFSQDLQRRMGGGFATTPRREADTPTLLSGVFNGRTTGTPLSLQFSNDNIRSKDYDNLLHHHRPSHGDRTSQLKYGGFNDHRGGGHLSGRLTLPFTAAGVVAKQMIGNVMFDTKIIKLGGESDPSRFNEVLQEAIAAKDSVGAIIETRVKGVEQALGEPFFDSTESVISHLLFSIPAVKGVEFGAGFEVANRRGSQNNDPIIDQNGTTKTNNDGGINGGITNGNELIVRVAIKPTPSIGAEQQTFDSHTNTIEPLTITGRHDCCIALRAQVVVEAAIAIALADLKLLKR